MKNILFFGGSSMLAYMWAKYWSKSYNISLGLNKRIININGTKSIDTKNLELLRKTLISNKITHIINCAGLTSVEQCQKKPELAFYLNSDLPGKIATITSQLNIKLIQISTDHLFDGKEKNYNETSKPNPLNIYSKSKLEGEEKVIQNANKSLVIRTNFFGEGPRYKPSFSDTIIHHLKQNKKISLFKDVFYTPISIHSLADCIDKLIDNDSSGIFNVVGNERINKYEFGNIIANELNLDKKLINPIGINQKTDLVIRPHDMSLSNNKLLSSIQTQIPKLSTQISNLKDYSKINVKAI